MAETITQSVTSPFGRWQISETGTVDDGQMIALSEFTSFARACGESQITVVASPGGAFAAGIGMWNGTCSDKDLPAGWMTQVASYRPDGDDIVLESSEGDLLARLAPVPGDSDSHPAPQRQTIDIRRLPDGLVAPNAEQIDGAWRPTGRSELNDEAGVEFSADNSLYGSDGCNGFGGLWALGPGGWFQAGQVGFTHAMGCDNIDVQPMVMGADQVALADSGNTIVFLDNGNELGRLYRDDG